MMEEANDEGALGSKICALKGKLESLLVLPSELLFDDLFKSVPVKMLLMLLVATLGGKLGGNGVESMEPLRSLLFLSLSGMMGLVGGSKEF